MSKHTKTPWKVDGKDPYCIKDTSGATSDASDIAYINEEKEGWAGGGDPKANAQFIVTACNAHDDLVEALREASVFMRGLKAATPQLFGPIQDAQLAQVQTALAKVEASDVD